MYEINKILVPMDGSPDAKRALPLAITLAKKHESEVILLHVTDLPTPTFSDETILHRLEEFRTQMLDRAHRYLSSIQAELREHEIVSRVIVRDTHPAREILSVAAKEDVDMIVMCAHGKGAMIAHSLGGVADKVVRQSHCPTLLVQRSDSSN